ncbi:MAG: hypothetical protein CMJ83_19560 [Planctomycetes bacterium]|nr:hypothetical protein [Planctomycetota bacterium]
MAPRKRPPSNTAPESVILSRVAPEDHAPALVARRFRALLKQGAELCPAGRARHDPGVLLTRRYLPRHELRLFDATFFLTDFRFDDGLSFFVASVVLREGSRGVRRIHPRIFYKDSGLVWRVASHFTHDEVAYWIGKGDVRWERDAVGEFLSSAEETTNLPYEIQTPLDEISRRARRRRDDEAIELFVRQAPSDRIAPYADFTAPRRRAAARWRINGGRPVARFLRRGDPSSLRFTRGYEPDFEKGVLEDAVSASRYFGGELHKYRILSTNRRIQYLFLSSPSHSWINHPQTLTAELSSYGVRTLDVLADEDLFVPGYEYHELDEDGVVVASQIPDGFAGEQHPDDPDRADASAWLEALPVIQEFRAKLRR